MSFQDEINAQHGSRQRADASAAPMTPGASPIGGQAGVAARRKPRVPGAPLTGRRRMLAQFAARQNG